MSKFVMNVESPRGTQVLHPSPARRDQQLTDILRSAHLPLNTRCGQRGRCDGCMVDLVHGSLAHVSTGQIVSADGQPVPVRGCEYCPTFDAELTIRIPPRSMLAYNPHVLTDYRINVPRAQDPLWQVLEIDPAGIEGELAAGLAAAVARKLDMPAPLTVAEAARLKLPALAGSMRLWATVEYLPGGWQVSDVSAGASAGALLGVAIDIGTTTVAILLVDLADGKVLAKAASFNQQMNLGDDVVTRIGLCSDPTMIRQLQEAVTARTLQPLLADALKQAHASAEQIKCVSVAGNTTMLHLFIAVDPSSLGLAPFTPVFLDHTTRSAGEIWDGSVPAEGAALAAGTRVHLLPGAAAYVGADLTAGTIASGLMYDDGPSLLVDVGTNGEIILKQGQKMLGCATAAGPAFEGGGLSSGIRAGDGAISYIELSAKPFAMKTTAIGRHKHPAGLCGSAYVDFLAQARKIGLLSPSGRFNRDAVPDAVSHLIPWGNSDTAFVVDPGQGDRPLVISQADIASLLQAKGAIAAGILILLDRMNLKPADVKRVYLAGGFGTHMNSAHAIGCGMLPGFTPEQVQPVGNTSLAGAYLALMDSGILAEMSRVGRSMEIVELNLDPNFETIYIDQLSLPDDD